MHENSRQSVPEEEKHPEPGSDIPIRHRFSKHSRVDRYKSVQNEPNEGNDGFLDDIQVDIETFKDDMNCVDIVF